MLLGIELIVGRIEEQGGLVDKVSLGPVARRPEIGNRSALPTSVSSSP